MLFLKLHVIGNGSGAITKNISDDFIRVCFNKEKLDSLEWTGDQIRISTKRKKGDEHGYFDVIYKSNPELANELATKMNDYAYSLRGKINAWPSSGFTFINTVWDLADELQIDRIGFNPKFTRESETEQQLPLSCAYHNWIGERGFSLNRLMNSPIAIDSWNSIFSDSLFNGIENINDPYELFKHGFTNRNIDSMRIALNTNYKYWKPSLTKAENWLFLENLLYISREKRTSPNWWLFSDTGTYLANTLSQLLRHHQNKLCFNENDQSRVNGGR